MAELYAKLAEYQLETYFDPKKWLKKFSTKWLEKNKPSELFRIQDVFTVLSQA